MWRGAASKCISSHTKRTGHSYARRNNFLVRNPWAGRGAAPLRPVASLSPGLNVTDIPIQRHENCDMGKRGMRYQATSPNFSA